MTDYCSKNLNGITVCSFPNDPKKQKEECLKGYKSLTEYGLHGEVCIWQRHDEGVNGQTCSNWRACDWAKGQA